MKLKFPAAIDVLAYLLGLLNLAAGIPKILQMSQEQEFLGTIGLSPTGVSMLGLIQLVGACTIPWKRTRTIGAALGGIALLVSAIAIFASGDGTFGTISLLPLILSLVVIYASLSRRGLRREV